MISFMDGTLSPQPKISRDFVVARNRQDALGLCVLNNEASRNKPAAARF
jgi:hypothetical protein